MSFLVVEGCKKYPYACDFYLPELDLYIEYQGFWSHGKEPFNSDNPEHVKRLNELKEKSAIRGNKRNIYKNAINVWTVKDPLKRETAKKNKLNWIEFFTLNDFLKWYSSRKI